MFLVVLLDVAHELLALKNLDVGGKADSNSYSGLKASIFDVFSPLSVAYSKPPPPHYEMTAVLVSIYV